MTQAELNYLVSQATGEEITEIQQRGFSLVGAFPNDALVIEDSAIPDPQVVDWDGPSGATQSFYESC